MCIIIIIISFDLAVASAESQRDRFIAIRSFVATAVSQRDLRSIAIRPFKQEQIINHDEA
jgi:hypothetical protein